MQQQSAHVLIIDDELPIRETLSELLEEEGYSVASVANGREALAYLDQLAEMPALILLDLTMPIMSGWEFRAQQQQHPVFSTIPVVVLSANAEPKKVKAVLQVDHFIAKPVDYTQLLSTIERYCAPPSCNE